MANEEENVIEIVIQEGDRHPLCPRRKPSCTRQCPHWLNDDIGCISLVSDPEEHERILMEYWERQERLEDLNAVES